MQITKNIIMPSNEEESRKMGEISFMIIMGEYDKAKKIAEQFNLMEYYKAVVEKRRQERDFL